MSTETQFRLLGTFDVRVGQQDFTPSAPKHRELLAVLVLSRSHLVTTSALIDELWGERPPRSALATLQTYIYKIRKLFRDIGDRNIVLATNPVGYLLEMPDELIDIWYFEELAWRGHDTLQSGKVKEAAELLSQALGVWRGQALADVPKGELLNAHVARLEEIRLSVLESRIEADLEFGLHRELIVELKELVAAHPLHENLHRLLMVALHRAGRRYEALDLYHQFRRVLRSRLGLEPGPLLAAVNQELLSSGEPVTLGPSSVLALSQEIAPGHPRPAQLPYRRPGFTGRSAALRQLRQFIGKGDAARAATPVIAITGLPGSGKTALAIEAAYQAADDYPDGSLYADLAGSTGQPRQPAEVLGEFLAAVGAEPGTVPDGLAERSSAFRSWTDSRSLLILLDDAASVHQVTPLLPGSEQCVVLVTSRRPMPGLPGAHKIRLGRMSGEDSIELLGKLAGKTGRGRECRLAESLVAMCGHLPGAIEAVARCLTELGTWPAAESAVLSTSPVRLEELRSFGFDIRSGLDSSFRDLSEPERSVFQLLGLFNGATFSASRAARLFGCDVAIMEELLQRLVENHLLSISLPDPAAEPRYLLPELNLLYARSLLGELAQDPGQAPGIRIWAKSGRSTTHRT
jgi:DNA-binding SARP family transcriptional activator